MGYFLGCYQTCLSYSISFLFSLRPISSLLTKFIFGRFCLEVILPQSADSQASSIFLTNFLSLAQPIFLFINSYFHLPTQSQYHQTNCSRFSAFFTSICCLIFCLHLNPATSWTHGGCQQDSLGEGSSSYIVNFPRGSLSC